MTIGIGAHGPYAGPAVGSTDLHAAEDQGVVRCTCAREILTP